MRTTITSALTGKAVTFDGNVQGRVGIRLGEIDAEKPGVILERDELLDALREALGVTIIDTPNMPMREVLAGEVVEGDVILTERGPRPIASVVRMDGNAYLYYRVPGGLDRVKRPTTSPISIRAAVVS